MLIAPEEIDGLIETAGLDRDAFQVLPLDDIPEGNKRYIICNEAVDGRTLEKINHSIMKVNGID